MTSLDRDKAWIVLMQHAEDRDWNVLLDELEACVQSVQSDPRVVACARCGRLILAETSDNTPDNDAMDVCSRCMHAIDVSRPDPRIAEWQTRWEREAQKVESWEHEWEKADAHIAVLEAKIEAITALCKEREEQSTASFQSMYGRVPFPAFLSAHEVRVILDGRSA